MIDLKKFNVRGVSLSIPEEAAKQLNILLSAMSQPVELAHMISVDDNGLIVGFSPPPDINWGTIFFIQNLMVSQRLFLIDSFLKKNEVIK